MRIAIAVGLAALVAGSLTACDDGGTPGATVNAGTVPGTLIQNPPLRVASLSATALGAQLAASASGQQLLAVAGTPTCGIDIHYFQYQTVGGAGESTTASGALMIPTGAAACTGPRPILVYTHGTATTKSFNIANIADPTNEAWTESAIIASMYAAQGYIVVASNYAGYDSSTLPYHPYLNADQQSKDVINALVAARTALPSTLAGANVKDNGKLFITGYSQGGLVAMATHKAMQARGMPVTASAPMSGPYAMEALLDAIIVYGNVGLGATVYGPMIINSYQHSYGNVYQATTDVFDPAFATGIDTLLPNALPATTLIAQGLLPEFAVFNSTTPVTGNSALDGALAVPANPLFALGFGSPSLFTNNFRLLYASDAVTNPDGAVPVPTPGLAPAAAPGSPLRQDLKLNDMRSWTPDGTAPMLLCGGHDDPEVLFSVNTGTMQAYWPALVAAGAVTIMDVDPGAPAASGGIAAQIGGIAAVSFGTDLAGGVTSAATLSADVQTAVIANFATYFTAGQPNSPQGVLVAALAGVAAQAVAQYYQGGLLDPTQMGTNVGFAIDAYYHFPSTQIACEVGARGFFANFQ